jgi:hypothetical protein
MLVLVFVGVHGRTELDEVVRGFLVLDAEVAGAVDFGSKGRISLVLQCPVDCHGVVLVGLEEPLLVWGQWSPIFLIGSSVEGARVEIAVEAHAGLQKGVGPLDAIVDERG